MKGYTTPQDIENYTLTEILDSFETNVNGWIAAAEKFIDNYTGRNFIAEDLTKKFDGNGKDSLSVDDLIAVEELTVSDGTTDTIFAGTDYFLYQGDDPNRTPYNRIEINRYGTQYIFPYGQQNVIIEGTWGYSVTVPDDIKLVATKLVASMINVGKNDGVQSYSEGDISVTYKNFESLLNSDVSVKQVLDFYKKPQRLMSFNLSRS